MDRLLTVRQAAERAAVSQSLIYTLCEQGLLPHLRLGRPGRRGCIRIDRDELEGFLAGLKSGSRQETPPVTPKAQPEQLRNLTLD